MLVVIWIDAAFRGWHQLYTKRAQMRIIQAVGIFTTYMYNAN